MLLGVFIRKAELIGDVRLEGLKAVLAEFGCELYDVCSEKDLRPESDMLLSVGGDGTFLSASRIAAPAGVPVLGVNLGRLGFLSEYKPDEIAEPLLAGNYSIEDRTMLSSVATDGSKHVSAISLNEVAVHRIGASMLGVDVVLDGVSLPTYWADGLLVATSSGSTAYSLSAGGPICMPTSRVLIIAPIAPHNLNVRPLVVPDSTTVEISVRSREERVMVTMDNHPYTFSRDVALSISVAQFSLKRVRLDKSNFISALSSKLFWGEDVRNL